MTDRFVSLLPMMTAAFGDTDTDLISGDNPYIRRDLGCMSLAVQAYLLAGYEGEPCAYSFDEEVPQPMPDGWFEIVGEETTDIYKDGVKLASITTCARGGAYGANLWVAANDENGKRHPELKLFADNEQPYWRPTNGR